MSTLEPLTARPSGRAARIANRPAGLMGRGLALVWRFLPTALAAAVAAGVVYAGVSTKWSLPKVSALRGERAAEPDDWCAEHSVPESACVECQSDLLPKGKTFGWCHTHGVHECPLDHPSVAELATRPRVTAEDLARAERALAFAPRPENNQRCKLHERRIQLASVELRERLGIELSPVSRARVTEHVTAPGEIGFDPIKVARVSARTPGSVLRVERRAGEKVKRGDVLAVVEAAEVGKVKAEFQQALAQLALREQIAEGLRASSAAVAGRNVLEADALVEESRVRLVSAEQALLNLGITASTAELRKLSSAELARRMQFFGLPDGVAKELAGKTTSSSLLPVTAPFDGDVTSVHAVPGEAADPTKPLFVVVDTARMWLTLRVRLEDAGRVKPGDPVRFRHAGHEDWDTGTVTWVSPAAEERSRAVPVRVELDNRDGRLHANTFGTAQILLREEPSAVVVPAAAVHWEGCCHVVFVRDRRSGTGDVPEVFHVRKVRPGATDAAVPAKVTEVIAGVLPGEVVATANSGVLRSELLKNNLGEG